MNIAKKAELYLKDEIKRFKIIEKVKFKIDTLNAERKSFIKDSAS